MDRGRAEALGGIILAENEIGPVIRADRAADYAAASRLVSRTHPRAWSDWQRLSGKPLPGGPERPDAAAATSRDRSRASRPALAQLQTC